MFEDWTRIALDVTHLHHIPYLSVVECGLGRFAVWKKVKRESDQLIVETLDEMFL